MGQGTEKATKITPRDPLLGRTLEGRYRLERRLGKGGMSTVYLAEQEAMNRRVAVKVLRLDLAEEQEMVERFIREARAASCLQHPHIVTVHDFGQTEDGYLYLAMELCEGLSLQHLLARGEEISRERALDIAHQLCDALAAAHDAGITHRDLKPENIMLTRVGDRSDFVKILDFGIARVAGGVSSAALTATGTLFGTPLYMAPEYIRGHGADHRVDLYALGMILWEMLAGLHPFEDDNPTTVMLAQLQEPVPAIGRIREELAGDLELGAFLERALAKTASERFQTAMEMRAGIERLARAGKISRAPGAPPSAEGSPLQDRGAPAGLAPVSAARLDRGESRPTEVGAALRRRKRRQVLLTFLIALMVTAGVVILLLRRGSERPQASSGAGTIQGASPAAPAAHTRAAPTLPPPAPARPLPAPAPPLRAAPVQITLRFRTTPPRAAVLLGDEVIATTPADYALARGAARLSLRFRKPGFAERIVKLTPDRSRTIEVHLRRVRRRPRRRRTRIATPTPTSPKTPPLTVATSPRPPATPPRPKPKPKPKSPRRTIYGMEFER